MTRAAGKTVAFWRIHLSAQGRANHAHVDWIEALGRIAALPQSERRHEEIVYDVNVSGHAYPIVAVHEALDHSFMSRIEDERVSDVVDEMDAETSKLANSTAIAFLGVGNVVAVVRGNGKAPQPPRVIETFLKAHLPQRQGVHWVVAPLFAPNQIAKLRDANGVVEFETRLETVKDLFSPVESDGILRYADELAQRVGADIVIEMKVRLASGSRGREATGKMHGMVMGDIPRVAADQRSRTKARALFGDGIEEQLSLVTHRMTTTIELNANDVSGIRFSGLVQKLVDVSAQQENDIRTIIGG